MGIRDKSYIWGKCKFSLLTLLTSGKMQEREISIWFKLVHLRVLFVKAAIFYPKSYKSCYVILFIYMLVSVTSILADEWHKTYLIFILFSSYNIMSYVKKLYYGSMYFGRTIYSHYFSEIWSISSYVLRFGGGFLVVWWWCFSR